MSYFAYWLLLTGPCAAGLLLLCVALLELEDDDD